MSRQIRLSKIHAINWYGYCDSLPVAGNLLLAGISGSGKSVLMDLMLAVLLGTEKARYGFNRAATGQVSGRTLKGYCLGDTKEEDAGTPQYMRPNGSVTYIALEFTWPGGKTVETWGLRIEFAGAAENSPRHLTPFFCTGGLGRSDFLDAERRPLSLAAFQVLVEARAGRTYERHMDDYRRDMAFPSHLNFDRVVMDRLLPMAMSFTFRSRFNDFCREHILPSEVIDVSDVTSSYRAYRQYEAELVRLRDQLQRLEAICALFESHRAAQVEKVVTQYLEHECGVRHAESVRAEKAAALERLRLENAAEREELERLGKFIQESEDREKELRLQFGERPNGPLYLRIQDENKILVRQISDLQARGKTAEQALAARVRTAQEWLAEVRRLDLPLTSSVLSSLEKAIRSVDKGGVAKADNTISDLQSVAADVENDVGKAAAPMVKRLAEVRRKRGQLKDEIARLRSGRLPFPTTVLDAINDALPWRGSTPPAQHLRALCEVTDEAWRPAIEVVFTRKFAVVVDVANYDEAERVFHSLTAADLAENAGRESLLNPAKALKLPGQRKPGSLAEKLHTEHPVAAAVIAHLFGDVICVEQREQLRDHAQSILPDGFMSRGAFVERRRFYDGNPFLGANGLQQQLAWKEKQDAELAAEEAKDAPLERAVNDVKDRFGKTFRPGDSLQRDLNEVRSLPEKEAKLKSNIASLNTLDRQAFEELEQQLAAVEAQIKSAREREKELLGSGRNNEEKRAEWELAQATDLRSQAEDRFLKLKLHLDVTAHLARLEALREDVLAKWPKLDNAADECARLFNKADKDAAALWPQVVSEREKLAIEHNRYKELDAHVTGNTEYEKHRQRIAGADIAEYAGKAEREQRLWSTLLREQVLEKMRAALGEVKNLIVLQNNFLKRPIGSSRYRIIHWDNKDYALQHRILEASNIAKPGELFFASADSELRDAVSEFLKLLTEQPDSKEAQRLLDYRNYFEYDMEVHNVEEPGSPPVRVDRKSDLFSGGENQSPYFIAILASYLRAYRRHEVRRKDPSLALVPIDEAFSKLSGERIRDCVDALKALDLQGVFSMSTGNIPYAYDLCDQLIVVTKHETREGRRLKVRNEPVILRRGTPEEREWLDLLGESTDMP